MTKFINEDHRKGLTHILVESRKVGINIKEISWVLPVSEILAQKNICYPFWRAVASQKRIDKICYCHSFDDIAYGSTYFLFVWSKTKEGYPFWKDTLNSLIIKYHREFWYYGWE